MYQDNFKRDEKILILPHNTLRYVDAMMILDIYKDLNIPYPNFEENLYKSVIRNVKDLSKIYNISDELKKRFKENWAFYYDIAPRTNVYEYISILSKQKFVKNTIILFDDRNASDSAFDNDYYDGSIESLEKYITNNNITTIVADDIELIKTLQERNKVDMNDKSIFISKTGYNYEYNKTINKIMAKEIFYTLQQKLVNTEIGILSLFDFSDDVIKNFREKIKKQKGNGDK